MGGMSSIYQSVHPEAVKELDGPKDHSMATVRSIWGKCAALKSILSTNGSRQAFLKFIGENDFRYYVNYYFEVDALLQLTKPEDIFQKSSQLYDSYYRNLQWADDCTDSQIECEAFVASAISSAKILFELKHFDQNSAERLTQKFRYSQAQVFHELSSVVELFLKSDVFTTWSAGMTEQKYEQMRQCREAVAMKTSSIYPNVRTEWCAKKFPRILIADDSLVCTKMMTLQLERQGHVIDQVHNGRDALKMIEKNNYDLVMIDIFMPILGGFETIKMIRKYEHDTRLSFQLQDSGNVSKLISDASNYLCNISQHPVSPKRPAHKIAMKLQAVHRITVVAISMDDSIDTQANSMECGANFFLKKPFSVKNFADVFR